MPWFPADPGPVPRRVRQGRLCALGARRRRHRQRSLRFDDNGTEFAWGGGAQVSFGSLAARLEYDNFDIENTDGVDLYTLGATWTFL